MSHRGPVSNNDAAIFNRTAVRTKKVNVMPKPQRGGTRF